MKRYFTLLLFLLLLSNIIPAQTRTDSISGTYTRHTWTGVGNMHFDYGEVTGYTISTTDETLLLEKNHCAALTVNTEPGNYGLTVFMSRPVVYYGIWRISGDTLTITYNKSYSEPFFTFYVIDSAYVNLPVKLSPPTQRKYLFEMGAITSLTAGDNENYQFYKEEEEEFIKE
ncbi:MAG: hypothetical protein M3R17_15145 [Bacteroidota bacterium]|nr:hypothetical protein [Bacteroidota bacterium]